MKALHRVRKRVTATASFKGGGGLNEEDLVKEEDYSGVDVDHENDTPAKSSALAAAVAWQVAGKMSTLLRDAAEQAEESQSQAIEAAAAAGMGSHSVSIGTQTEGNSAMMHDCNGCDCICPSCGGKCVPRSSEEGQKALQRREKVGGLEDSDREASSGSDNDGGQDDAEAEAAAAAAASSTAVSKRKKKSKRKGRCKATHTYTRLLPTPHVCWLFVLLVAQGILTCSRPRSDGASFWARIGVPRWPSRQHDKCHTVSCGSSS